MGFSPASSKTPGFCLEGTGETNANVKRWIHRNPVKGDCELKSTWRWALVVLSLLIVIAAPAARADDKKVFAYRFIPGEVHEYRFTHITESLTSDKYSTEVVLRFAVNVLETEPDGSAKIHIAVHPLRIKLTNRRTTTIIDPSVSTDDAKVMLNSFSEPGGESITMTVEQSGRCRNIRGSEIDTPIIMSCMSADPSCELSFLDRTQWTVFSIGYPVEPIGIGDAWEFSLRDSSAPQAPSMRWRYSEISNGAALFIADPMGKFAFRLISSTKVQDRTTSQTEWDLTGKSSARAWVNPETGWVERYIFEELLEGTKATKKGIGLRRTKPASIKVTTMFEKLSGQ